MALEKVVMHASFLRQKLQHRTIRKQRSCRANKFRIKRLQTTQLLLHLSMPHLRMSVTPQITSESTIIMEIELENNRPNFTVAVGAAGGTPPIFIERATTTLLVEDGGTTVIGGIFQATDQYSQGRTPILHRIPLLGWLFKNTNIIRSNTELLIFITPRILR